MTGAYHHAQVLIEMGVSWTFFCLVWLSTAILQISASQVGRITGVNHWLLAVASFLILRGSKLPWNYFTEWELSLSPPPYEALFYSSCLRLSQFWFMSLNPWRILVFAWVPLLWSVVWEKPLGSKFGNSHSAYLINSCSQSFTTTP
jgi:hypothetical protein